MPAPTSGTPAGIHSLASGDAQTVRLPPTPSSAWLATLRSAMRGNLNRATESGGPDATRPVPSLAEARARLAGFRTSVESMDEREWEEYLVRAAAAEAAAHEPPPAGGRDRVEVVRTALREGRLDPTTVAEATGVPAHVIGIWAVARRDLVHDSWRIRLEEWATTAGSPSTPREDAP